MGLSWVRGFLGCTCVLANTYARAAGIARYAL